MKLATGENLLTVKDIAECISYDRSEEGIARTLRQVRHWTQCDLLRTMSEKNPGKGVPRFYEDEPSLLIAAILFELCRYGATVDILKPVADHPALAAFHHLGNDVALVAHKSFSLLSPTRPPSSPCCAFAPLAKGHVGI